MNQGRKIRKQRFKRSKRLSVFVSIAAFSLLLTGHTAWRWLQPSLISSEPDIADGQDVLVEADASLAAFEAIASLQVPAPNGRPRMYPLPDPEEVWQCEVVVIGGTLGGVAAASHAMSAGAQTCLIEVTPWLGGQISSQGVSAIDESWTMRQGNKFSTSWQRFKTLIGQQPIELPSWTGAGTRTVDQLNSCWVGDLCFPPEAGDRASQQLLEQSAQYVEGSRWSTSTAFKGATFDETGRNITAIYGVRRSPIRPDYQPQGRLWSELSSWYSWSEDDEFEKTSIRLEPPPGRSFLVIDATDTGELVGWAKIPHRQGSESAAMTQEDHAPAIANPDCTQAFTFPFVVAIRDDGSESLTRLQQVKSEFNLIEHWREYSLNGTPMFAGRSFFNYRRMVSLSQNDPVYGTPIPGDMTLVNWNPGNDWNWMNPPLILTEERLTESGQYLNWMGGISTSALRHGSSHALLFARWLLESQSQPGFSLSLLDGVDSPMGTQTGLSLTPYIREGRRILGRNAYGEDDFMVKATDVRWDTSGGRLFNETAVALVHYDLDMHGCRYRNWEPSLEASGAPVREYQVRPTAIPLESLIPQNVDNMLVGSKAIAVTHIVNAMTRIHYSEWSIGAAAGATAGWLVREQNLAIAPADIVPNQQMPQLQAYIREQGLRIHW
ncbi:MAG: FAD-dependent oxidoreductase [Elainellaceae cyanobacterium]